MWLFTVLLVRHENKEYVNNRCLMLDSPVTTCMGNGCSPGDAGNVFDGVLFCAVLFSPRDVLDTT